MLKRGNYPKEVVEKMPEGFRGEMELLGWEYSRRAAALDLKLDELLRTVPELNEIKSWYDGLAEDRKELLSGIEDCALTMEKMEVKVKEGLLSLMDEQVVADVAAHELQILNSLTAMQRINSASLQRVFALNLPALAKNIEKPAATVLREAIVMLMEDTQFMSNELQDFAIFVKERNKIITHPLDENHPE